ncbi:MAG: right-handed parallel beta-helix repeat-containing protein [Candidatus Thorarchaeota archaeon]
MYFKITNCFLITDWSDPEIVFNYAIWFENVSNAIISNNTIKYSYLGVKINGCSNITFENNFLRLHIDGMDLSSSTNIQIINNTLSKIGHEAISLQSSEYNIISGNTILETWGFTEPVPFNGTGIYIQASSKSNISKNTIIDTEGDGIRLLNSRELMIFENIIT